MLRWRVREIAEAAGIRTAKELRIRSELPASTISRIWKGTAKRVDLAKLDKLAKTLAVPVCRLLEGESNNLLDEFNRCNPYLDDQGQPRLRYSFALFADVLGFGDRLSKAAQNGEEEALLREYYGSLIDMGGLIGQRHGKIFGGRTHAFTDNIVVGVPVYKWVEVEKDEGPLVKTWLGSRAAKVVGDFKGGTISLAHLEGSMGEMLRVACLFQASMVGKGFFIRGGLALGDLHMSGHDESRRGDELTGDLSFGTAQVEAYDLEREQACWPRVILSRKVSRVIDEIGRGYRGGHSREASIGRYILSDGDGHSFVNYLDAARSSWDPDPRGYEGWDDEERACAQWLDELRADQREWLDRASECELLRGRAFQISSEYGPPMFDYVANHKEVIERRLAENSGNQKIVSKYLWSARYHNWFCEANYLPDYTILCGDGKPVSGCIAPITGDGAE
jgi:transcriptional regulator with XRE-family HTH domain